MSKSFLFSIALLCGLITVPISAQQSDKTGAGEDQLDFKSGPGIEVGSELPEIRLKNQDDTEVSIHKLLEKGPVALVFFRSADW